jgi:hypothetical protein
MRGCRGYESYGYFGRQIVVVFFGNQHHCRVAFWAESMFTLIAGYLSSSMWRIVKRFFRWKTCKNPKDTNFANGGCRLCMILTTITISRFMAPLIEKMGLHQDSSGMLHGLVPVGSYSF